MLVRLIINWLLTIPIVLESSILIYSSQEHERVLAILKNLAEKVSKPIPAILKSTDKLKQGKNSRDCYNYSTSKIC